MISSIKKLLLSLFICSSCVYAQNDHDFDDELLNILRPLKSILHEPLLSRNAKDKLEKSGTVFAMAGYKLIKDAHNKLGYQEMYGIDSDKILKFIQMPEEKFAENSSVHYFAIEQVDNVVDIESTLYTEHTIQSVLPTVEEQRSLEELYVRGDHSNQVENNQTFEWGTCQSKNLVSFDRTSGALRTEIGRMCKISLSKAEFQKYINELKKQ